MQIKVIKQKEERQSDVFGNTEQCMISAVSLTITEPVTSIQIADEISNFANSIVTELPVQVTLYTTILTDLDSINFQEIRTAIKDNRGEASRFKRMRTPQLTLIKSRVRTITGSQLKHTMQLCCCESHVEKVTSLLEDIDVTSIKSSFGKNGLASEYVSLSNVDELNWVIISGIWNPAKGTKQVFTLKPDLPDRYKECVTHIVRTTDLTAAKQSIFRFKHKRVSTSDFDWR